MLKVWLPFTALARRESCLKEAGQGGDEGFDIIKFILPLKLTAQGRETLGKPGSVSKSDALRFKFCLGAISNRRRGVGGFDDGCVSAPLRSRPQLCQVKEAEVEFPRKPLPPVLWRGKSEGQPSPLGARESRRPIQGLTPSAAPLPSG